MRKNFGRRLRFLRKLEHLTQEQLAEKASISWIHLNRIERGVSAPSFEVLERLCLALSTEPANLFLFSEFPPAKDDASDKTTPGGVRLQDEASEDADRPDAPINWTRYATRLGSWTEEPGKKTLAFSPALYDLLGYGRARPRATRKFLASHVHPDDRGLLEHLRQDVMGGITSPVAQLRLMRKDATERLAIVQVSHKPRSDGSPGRIFGTVMDATELVRLADSLRQTHGLLEERIEDRTAKLNKTIQILGKEIGERKQAEEALKRSEYRLMAAQEIAEVGHWEYTPGTDTILWSDQLYRIMGHEPGSFTPRRKDLLEQIHPEDRSRVDARINKAMKAETTYEQEFRVVRKDKMVRHCRTRAVVERNGNAEVVLIRGILQDVTARRLAEQALAAQEEKYRVLFDSSPAGILLTDEEGVIIECNEQGLDLLGMENEEVVGRFMGDPRWRLSDSMGAPLASSTYPAERARLERRLVKEEVILPLGGGLVRHLSTICAPIPLAGYGVASIITDISERRRIEIALRESEERNRSLVSAMPDMLFVVDEHGTYLDFHAQSPEELYSPPDHFLGRTVEEVMPAEIARKALGAISASLAGETVETVAVSLQLKGRTRHYEWRCAPMQGRRVLFLARDVTERVEAETALKESEARFRNLLDQIPNIAVQGYGPDGTVYYWNQANTRLYGYAPEEALGRDLVELIIPPGMRAEARRTILRGAATGVMPPPGELELTRKDGSKVKVHSTHVVQRLPGAEPLLFCIDVDLTELKKSQAALEESEKRYRTLFEAAADAIYVHDLEGRFIDANQIGYERLGYTREELLSMSVRDIDSENDAARIPERVRQVTDKGFTTFEVTHHHRDGRNIPVEINARLIDYQGAPAVISMARDLTRRRKAEKNLRESEERQRALIDALPDLLFVFDSENHFLSCHVPENVKPLLPPESFIGRKVEDVFAEPFAAKTRQIHRQALETGSVVLDEYSLEIEGESRYFERRVAPMGPDRVVAVVRDVTEAKRFEAMRENVERIIRHDLKTPAISAVSAANLLKRSDCLDEEMEEVVDDLAGQARRMLDILNMSGVVFRMESGRFEPDPRSIDLSALVREVVNEIGRIPEAERICFDLEGIGENDGNRVAVMAEPLPLRTLLTNLCKNAVEASKPGDSVSLRLGRESGRAVLTIHNPAEVPEEVRERFFEKFATHGKRYGTGLGTYTARLIARAYGGDVTMRTSAEAGTRVTVTLPDATS